MVGKTVVLSETKMVDASVDVMAALSDNSWVELKVVKMVDLLVLKMVDDWVVRKVQLLVDLWD